MPCGSEVGNVLWSWMHGRCVDENADSRRDESSSGSGKKPQVKRMPKRPAAKLMPRRLKITKVKTEPGTTAKVPGKNRFKNQETKRRQKAKWEEIKRTSKEERAQPAPAFEIPARGGDVPVRSFFDPISGRRETMEVKPLEREQKFRTVQTGFSRYPTETRTCYQCGEKGHLSANCPQKMRRVSLTEGVIKYEGAGETRPRVRLQGNMGSIPQETSEFDDVRPEDSASQVGGQYLGTMSTVGGSVKKNLPPPPPPPPMAGSPKIARSRPGVPPQTSATSAPMQPPPAPRLRLSFLRTHLQERVHRHRADLMWGVPRRRQRRHPRGRQQRHRQWKVFHRSPKRQRSPKRRSQQQRSEARLGESWKRQLRRHLRLWMWRPRTRGIVM